ncbi:hypothetical protein ACQ5SO_08710 [Rhodovulum sp. DZ06]|uniref:hypothetical protein n=1 Tax=Rhodovulum sp. DZ06 TaxID=3425126 RepID=UPI003D3285C9
MGSTVAYLVLFSWPLVMHRMFKRMPVHEAIAWGLLAGLLLLPERVGYALPALPNINKDVLPTLTALLYALFGVRMMVRRRRDAPGAGPIGAPGAPAGARRGAKAKTAEALPGWLPASPVVIVLLAMSVSGPMLSGLQNTDPVVAGDQAIRGMTMYDNLSGVQRALLAVLPLLLARRYLFAPAHHAALVKVVVIAMLGYALLMAFEVRFSPQLHNIFYGFFQHDFAQTVRYGGFRPVVFLPNGLVTAMMAGVGFIAAIAWWKAMRRKQRREGLEAHAGLVAMAMTVTLLITKSIGAVVSGAFLGAIAFMAGRRTQLTIAALCALLAIGYPALRGGGLVPTQKILSAAAAVGKEGSMRVRFQSEDRLINKAMQRPLFGWGGLGRNRYFNTEAWNVDTGVTDGYWTIVITSGGWYEYIARFGLLCLPVLMIWRRRKDEDMGWETAAISLMLAMNLLDLLPNAGLTPVTFLLAGALLGNYEWRARRDKALRQARAARRAGEVEAEAEALEDPLFGPQMQADHEDARPARRTAPEPGGAPGDAPGPAAAPPPAPPAAAPPAPAAWTAEPAPRAPGAYRGPEAARSHATAAEREEMRPGPYAAAPVPRSGPVRPGPGGSAPRRAGAAPDGPVRPGLGGGGVRGPRPGGPDEDPDGPRGGGQSARGRRGG